MCGISFGQDSYTARKVETGEEFVLACGTIKKIDGDNITILTREGITQPETKVTNSSAFKVGDEARVKMSVEKNGIKYTLLKGCS